MACESLGAVSAEVAQDRDGHREYRVTFRVRGLLTDGPAAALQASGLPAYGAEYLVKSDVDVWAFRKLETAVRRSSGVKADDPCRHFDVTCLFSTKPDTKFCKDNQFNDPLTEPQKVSGSFVKFTEEATHDMFGKRLTNSAFQQLYGPQVEFDAGRPQVIIEQNVPRLQHATVAAMLDTVNNQTLWGFPRRTVKLSDFSWEKKYYGTCGYYFTRRFTFDVRYRARQGVSSAASGTDVVPTDEFYYETWDRNVLDKGTKVLSGRWVRGGAPPVGTNTARAVWQLVPVNGQTPDPNNPAHFIRATDRLGNPMEIMLNGAGLPAEVGINTGTGQGTGATAGATDPGEIWIQKYGESDFLILDIPVSLE